MGNRIQRSAHSLPSSSKEISEKEQHWVLVGIAFTKVLAPALRKVVATELGKWYHSLCQPPDEIHMQDFAKHKNKLPPSKQKLEYRNINNNRIHKLASAYDYAVKDPLSLAKLFLKEFMAHCTGFDETMDMSALLTIMGEAAPFVSSGAAAEAKKVRSDIRNPWAHCNISEWTVHKFNASFQAMESLVKTINFPAGDEKKICDDLVFWTKTDILVDGRHATLVSQSIAELCRYLKSWKLQADTEVNAVAEKLDIIYSKLLRRVENVEQSTVENREEIKHLKERVSESQHQEREKYSKFAEEKVPYGLRSLPRDIVERPSKVNEILRLLAEGNSRVGVVGSRGGDIVGIRGMGGLGKTILALAVAWKVSVSRQVIWLDIGETPDCLSLINLLIKVLGGEVSFSDIRAAQAWVRANTSDKDCLVILDDVWSVNHASQFDHLSGKCQLLITTRDSEVVRGLQGSALYTLQLLERDDSYKLLYQTARVTADEQSEFSSNMRQIIKELLNHCGDLPLALSLVGSSLGDTRDEQDWEDVLNDLKTADLVKLRSIYPANAYPYDNVLTAINASFQHLHEGLREKFLDFALFPEDADVPLDILELFWFSKVAGRTSCSRREGRRILDELEKKSMIQKGSDIHGNKSYRLHDLLLGFAGAKLGGKLSSVQCLLVEALRGHCENGDWGKFKGNKDYYFKYLTYHLYSSEQFDKLHKLFFNFNWLYEKVNQFDLPSLISDFRFLDTPSKEIELLKTSLMLSSTVIEKNLHSIGPQLLGRLLSYEEFPGIKTLLEQLRATCTETCRLIPEFSCLDLGGPEIFRKTFDSEVYSLATSTTSSTTLVICGFWNGSITIFDLDTGREVQQLLGHSERVSCLAVSQSGTILASGSWDRSTILWRMDNYEQLFVFEAESGVNALDFSADDQRVFIGTGDGLKVYCVSTGENLSTSIPEGVTSLCTTKDGQFIATVGSNLDGTIKLWNADTLNFKASLVGHTAWVSCVVATESGNNNPMLVSGSGDGTIEIWDLKKYQEIRTLKGHESYVTSVAVSGDKKYIISGDLGGSARLWCFHTGKCLSCYEGHTNFISGVAIIPNAKKVLTASWDRSIRVWNLGTAAYMEQNSLSDHSKDVTDITIARARGDSRCVSASKDGTFKVWNLHTQCFSVTGDLEWAKHVAVSADDQYVVSLSNDDRSTKSSIKVWNLSDGSVINEIDSDGTPKIVRFSSDGLQVIIGCKDNHVFIWDWQKPYASLKEVILPSSYTVEIACDRNMIYTCSRDMHICEINLDSLQVSTVRQGSSVPPVISPDGKIVLFGSLQNNVFFHWKLSTDSWVDHNAGHPDDSIVTAIDITSNGEFALSGSSSGTLSLVDIECSKIVQFAKTESGVPVRFVCLLSDDVRFVFVDEANRIELRTFNDIEASINLGQPEVKVTCITALGSNYALLGCDDGELLWFHLNDKSQLKFSAHKDVISQVKGELGGHDRSLHFASGSIGGSVKLWNVEENLPTLIWSHDNICSDSITALEFVPCSDDIIIASDNKIDRINANGVVSSYEEILIMKRIKTMRVVQNSLFCVHQFEYDDDTAEEKVTKWNLNDTKIQSTSRFPTVKVLRINNSGNLVAILGRGSLVIENFITGKVLHRFPLQNAKRIRALALAPAGKFLLSCSHFNKTLKLWNLPNRDCVEEFHFDRDVLAIACGSNGMVCVGLEGGRVCFLRLNKLPSHSKQLKS